MTWSSAVFAQRFFFVQFVLPLINFILIIFFVSLIRCLVRFGQSLSFLFRTNFDISIVSNVH